MIDDGIHTGDLVAGKSTAMAKHGLVVIAHVGDGRGRGIRLLRRS